MTDEEIRIAETVLQRLHPVQYSAAQRLQRRLKREHSDTWSVSVNYGDAECLIVVVDAYGARVETRVEEDGAYTVTVCDNWFYTGITVKQESAAMQVMRLELEHQRFTMPNLYHK